MSELTLQAAVHNKHRYNDPQRVTEQHECVGQPISPFCKGPHTFGTIGLLPCAEERPAAWSVSCPHEDDQISGFSRLVRAWMLFPTAAASCRSRHAFLRQSGYAALLYPIVEQTQPRRFRSSSIDVTSDHMVAHQRPTPRCGCRFRLSAGTKHQTPADQHHPRLITPTPQLV